MTIDDAAAILDVTEGHVKDLIRDGELWGAYLDRGGDSFWHGVRSDLKRGEWWVDGKQVRRRRSQLAKRRRA